MSVTDLIWTVFFYGFAGFGIVCAIILWFISRLDKRAAQQAKRLRAASGDELPSNVVRLEDWRRRGGTAA